MKMTTGRMWDAAGPEVQGPAHEDRHRRRRRRTSRDIEPHPARSIARRPRTSSRARVAAIKDKSIPTFELQRGSSNADPETEWLINGQQFEPTSRSSRVKKDSGGVWRIRNGGGGWVHPLHLHMEEHRVVAAQRQARAGRAPPGRHAARRT